MAKTSGSSDSTQPDPRCVLLVGESGAVPSSLVGALDRRGLDIVIARQPPQVMFELATPTPAPGKSRSEHHASAGGKPEDNPSANDREASALGLSVVVVEPQLQPRIDELQAAINAYYPAVRCWQYHAHGPDGRASLETLVPPSELAPTPSDLADPQPEKPTQDFVADNTSNLHTSETDSEDTETDVNRIKGANQRLRSLVVQVDDPRPQDDGPLVSEEELAMLLSPSPPETPEASETRSAPRQSDRERE